MKRVPTISALTAFAIMALASTVFATPTATTDGGAIQISGVAYYAAAGQCNDPQGDGSDYALNMTGDLSGCHYTFVEVSRCSPGGAYYESGTETFVGMYNGGSGTFETTYVFTAVYRECPAFVGERAGRCQHPITAGSGTGVFDGVRGRIDMKDDVAAGNFPYRGHLSFDNLFNSTGRLSPEDPLNLMSQSITGGGC
ncbi:MAG TPA: hypothetical protein VFZ23_17545 [Pyrinomonadaceae bacterium]